jgi:hypothetical protein
VNWPHLAFRSSIRTLLTSRGAVDSSVLSKNYHSHPHPMPWFLFEVVIMGYSPLGSSFDRHPEAHGTTLLKNPIVNEIAAVRPIFHTAVYITYAMTLSNCVVLLLCRYNGRRLGSQQARC